jgi:hypothetical protein
MVSPTSKNSLNEFPHGEAIAGVIHGCANSLFHLPETRMYHHIKKLMFTVRVGEPDRRFGNMLLEQFGGLPH